MTIGDGAFSTRIQVLLADSKPLESQLFSGSLRERGFEVWPCDAEISSILELFDRIHADVAIISCATPAGMPDVAALRTLHLTHPGIPKIFLMDSSTRELTVQAFRAGARGLFTLADSSFQELCECIERVYRGDIFATMQQLNWLLESICQVPSLKVIGQHGDSLLTSREEQVVALVTDGLSNRDVASELGLSEHTVKKYLFRIFEKLGISSRVELVLYALHNGGQQPLQFSGGIGLTSV